MAKTIGEINEKLRRGKAVVATAAEIIDVESGITFKPLQERPID